MLCKFSVAIVFDEINLVCDICSVVCVIIIRNKGLSLTLMLFRLPTTRLGRMVQLVTRLYHIDITFTWQDYCCRLESSSFNFSLLPQTVLINPWPVLFALIMTITMLLQSYIIDTRHQQISNLNQLLDSSISLTSLFLSRISISINDDCDD